MFMLRRRTYLLSSFFSPNYCCGCSRLMSAAASSSSSSVPAAASGSASLSSSSSVVPKDSMSSSCAVSLFSCRNGANFASLNRPTLRLRSCFSNNPNFNSNHNSTNDCSGGSVNGNALRKARAYVPSQAQLQLLRGYKGDHQDSVRHRGDVVSQRGASGVGLIGKNGEKVVVAVDVDEVLGNFVSALNKFIAAHYSSNHTVSEYHDYEFFKIWNCSRGEADIRVHEFFKTPYFKTGIHPLPGAQEALQKLCRFCNLSIVTSRQHVIKDHTVQWIEEHFPGIFQEIHFGNHFALDGESRPKSDICKALGAQVLIDDNPRYAMECAEVGVRVLLFDYENSYPWSKMESLDGHPLVTRVHNWEEVEHQLASWVIS